MPIRSLTELPDSARCWIFAAASPLTGDAATALLGAVDQHLAQWAAHGTPLVCARDWQHDRFLTIAVDEAATGASGCSIDGLFRLLAEQEAQRGVSLTDGARVYWRHADGTICADSRPAFKAAVAAGAVTATTPVFDTTITDLGRRRAAFEVPAAVSWHQRHLPASADGHTTA